MEITIGNTPEFILKAQSIRHQVFVVEQDIPHEKEFDNLDNTSLHILVTDDSKFIATARLYIEESGHAKAARLAVVEKYRGSGVGSKVIEFMILHARNNGVVSLEIHAHKHLQRYYEKFGFKFICDAGVVGKHSLIKMRHQIDSPKLGI